MENGKNPPDSTDFMRDGAKNAAEAGKTGFGGEIFLEKGNAGAAPWMAAGMGRARAALHRERTPRTARGSAFALGRGLLQARDSISMTWLFQALTTMVLP